MGSLLQSFVFKCLDEIRDAGLELEVGTIENFNNAVEKLKDGTAYFDEKFLVEQTLSCTLHIWRDTLTAKADDVPNILRVFFTVFSLEKNSTENQQFESIITHKDLSEKRKGRFLQVITQIIKATILSLHQLREPNRIEGKPKYGNDFVKDVKIVYWARLFNVNVTFVERPITIV